MFNLKKKKLLIFCLILFSLLSLAVTFLSPFKFLNLTPQPDTLYYLNGANNLINGKGLVLSYQSHEIEAQIPPLYPLSLAVILLFNKSLYTVYFLNLFFGLAGFYLFYLIAEKMIVQKKYLLIACLLYISNFILIWYPSLVMAENLLLVFFYLSIYLLMEKISGLNLILLAILPASLFAVKYVAWPLSFSLFVIAIIKIYLESTKKIKLKNLLSFILIFSLSLEFSVVLEILLKDVNPLTKYFTHLTKLVSALTPSLAETKEMYSLNDLANNSYRYLAGLIGGSISLAGRETILLPPLLSICSFASFFYIYRFKNKLMLIYFFSSLIITFLYLIVFAHVDARYLYVFIPGLILTAVLFFHSLSYSIKQKPIYVIIPLLLVCTLIFNFLYLFNQLNQFKKDEQKYPIYNAAKTIDKFFNNQNNNNVYIITVISPYYLQTIAPNTPKLLPLSPKQPFATTAEETRVIKKVNNYQSLYLTLLNQGNKLYLSSFATDPHFFYNLDLSELKKNFKLVLQKEGCSGSCNIYELIPINKI